MNHRELYVIALVGALVAVFEFWLLRMAGVKK